MEIPCSIYEGFSRIVTLHADRPALMSKDEQGIYRPISFSELYRRVDGLARSLRELGISKGDRLAVLARNGPDWVVADLAALKSGAIVVPLYTTLSPSALKYIISDSGSKLVFAGDAKLFTVADSIRRQVQSVRDVVVLDQSGIGQGSEFISFGALLEKGMVSASALRPGQRPSETATAGSEPGWAQVTLEDPAAIVYTSGTTGEPKGVVLTHGNILSNVRTSIERFRVTSADRFLSFLPLSHTFERTAGYYTFLLSGATIAYASDMTTIVQDAQKIRPTVLIVVPRILEKAYDTVQSKVAEGSALQRKLVRSAVVNLNRRVNLVYRSRAIPPTLKLKCLFYDRVVARKFRNIAGGKLRLIVSGAAPLDRRLAKTFLAFGFNLFEGYGLTETSPCVCSTSFDDNRLGTVGKPYDGVEIKIADQNEVLVRGPNVMKSYFNKPEETARAIDPEGWLHTGDQGRFDRRGNLIITGRIKELIVTSYGKNVAPVPIETSIKESDYIEDVMLYGDNEKYLAAIVVAQREAVERYAHERGIQAANFEELLKTDEIRAVVSSEIENATGMLSPFEKVKAFTLVSEGFTVANDLLTPTLKLRREKVREKYREAIEAMYGRFAGTESLVA